MKNIIFEKLQEIEETRQVKVLFACEAGSRAWGFHSVQSDYDVRFVYLQHRDHYVTLGNPNDSLNFGVNQQLDLNGWDVRKFLQLMAKSNATVMEWLRSPVGYVSEPAFVDEARQLMVRYFNPLATYYHYAGLARNHMEEVSQLIPTVKVYLHAARALIAAQWVVRNQSPPPTLFNDLLRFVGSDSTREVLDQLMLMKRSDNNLLTEKVAELEQWMEQTFTDNEHEKATLKHEKVGLEELDVFYRKVLGWSEL